MCTSLFSSGEEHSSPEVFLHMPLRETAPKLSPDQYEKNFADIEPAMTAAPGCHRIRALPLLLRCALHRRLPHAHRRSRVHQENLHRQPARFRARDSFREHSGPQLRPRLPHRSSLRRRLRDARKGRSSHRNRPPAALRRRLRARSTICSSFSRARTTASASPASAPGPLRSPARRSWPSGATTSPFSIARKIPAA